MKVPTIPTVRIAILIASFALIFTFMVVLLGSWGFSCSGRPSQVTLVMQAACQTRGMGRRRAAREFPCKTAGKSGFCPHLGPGLWPGRGSQLKQKCGSIAFMLGAWNGGVRSVRVYSLRHGR